MFEPINPDDITRAAEMRAQGAPWETVAAELQRSPHTVRQWSYKLGKRWTKALEQAEAEQLRLAANESRNVLRNQLRTENDPKLNANAATVLLKHDTAKTKTSKPKAPRAANNSAVRMAEFVEGLSDDELEDILQTVVDLEAAEAAMAQPAAAGTSLAAGPSLPERLPAVLLPQSAGANETGPLAS